MSDKTEIKKAEKDFVLTLNKANLAAEQIECNGKDPMQDAEFMALMAELDANIERLKSLGADVEFMDDDLPAENGYVH